MVCLLINYKFENNRKSLVRLIINKLSGFVSKLDLILIEQKILGEI